MKLRGGSTGAAVPMDHQFSQTLRVDGFGGENGGVRNFRCESLKRWAKDNSNTKVTRCHKQGVGLGSASGVE